MQWDKTYGGAYDDRPYSLVQTNDGGYAIAGWTNSFGAGDWDFWVVRTDSSGNVQWGKTYGGERSDKAYSLVQTSDGGYAIAGTTASYRPFTAFWLIKLAPEARAEWTVMVYLDADNNLEDCGIEDFLEISAADSISDVNLVVQMDRISGGDGSYGARYLKHNQKNLSVSLIQPF